MKISVCMATYNGELYIRKQLHSILSQIGKNDEVIISDDGSIDETISIVESFADNRIQIINNKRIKGPVLNFENALINSAGEIIYLADQDDIWEINKIRVMTEYLHKHDMVICDAILIDNNGEVIKDSFYKLRNSGTGFLKNLFKNTYLGCCMAFNRKILEKSLPFPSNIPMHDIWLGMIGELFGTTFFCKEKLVYFRRHTSSASSTGAKSKYSVYNKIMFRYFLLYQLSKRYVTLQKLHLQ